MPSAGAYVALMYERYRQTYNVPDDGLAEVSINNRKHAKLNANAVMHDDLDVNIYMESRFVAEPLRLYDYCPINDGGVALILTSVRRAKKLGKAVIDFRHEIGRAWGRARGGKVVQLLEGVVT